MIDILESDKKFIAGFFLIDIGDSNLSSEWRVIKSVVATLSNLPIIGSFALKGGKPCRAI